MSITLSGLLGKSKPSLVLRPYQKKALETIDKDLQKETNVLLQAATGAGKTIIVSALICKYMEETDRKFLILAHKSELVEQFSKALNGLDVGICCASLRRKEIDKRITIATVQTFVNQVDKYNGCDLLVIDEAHRASIGSGSQYDKTITSLRKKTPNMRLLGLTATPSRMGHGYIYGKKCRPKSKNIFPRLNHQIKYKALKDAGFLMPLHGEIAMSSSYKRDMRDVDIKGDFVLEQIGEIMSQEVHLDTAKEAIDKYCEDFKHICIFCCTIFHAEELASLLGDECTVVHSQLPAVNRLANMNKWQTGKCRMITSVNILVEGFDFPPLDCLIMARPTLSSNLYLQAIGRVLRINEGKTKALLVDMTDNTERFGTDLDNVKVEVPREVAEAEKKERDMIKICPMCEDIVHIALRQCSCGFKWPEEECCIAEKMPELKSIMFEPSPPVWMHTDYMYIGEHTSKKTGKTLGKITISYSLSDMESAKATLWFCLPDEYSGYAVTKAKEKWEELTKDPFPETIEEFLLAGEKLVRPTRILLDMNGKYPEIKGLELVPF